VAEVFDYLAKDYLRRKHPMRGGTKRGGEIKTISVAAAKSSAEHKTVSVAEVNNKALVTPTRQRIPISLKRIVWTRDQGQCQHYNSLTGKKCGSPYLLEIGHIKRVRHGGDNEPGNLRLLCHSHNHFRG
jgi:5-methylcytosine-specific restriction endonuclease McrA